MPAGRKPNPDQVEQGRKNIYNRRKAQANYRGETWNIDFEQWWGIWRPYWDLRGRCPTDYCMRQLDPDLGWEMHNIEICDRLTFFKQQRKRNQTR